MTVGIIGLGFVGSAVKNAYDCAKIATVCLDPQKDFFASSEELKKSDVIFICVPSPQLSNGSCDISILESVLEEFKDYQGVFISKVTAPPTAYRELQLKYKNLVHAPEFLVAATAKEDYVNGEFAIVGGCNLDLCKIALDHIKLGQPKIRNHVFCNIQEASLAKYTINSFLATKVIFMNQIKQLADAIGVDYETLISGIQLDSRIGDSHFSVPGPDGKYGFGGACFPKDTSALHYTAKENGVEMTVLHEVIQTNKGLR
jgi:UDPglucose 6-dehydrogenase